jgi:hypothetical protein
MKDVRGSPASAPDAPDDAAPGNTAPGIDHDADDAAAHGGTPGVSYPGMPMHMYGFPSPMVSNQPLRSKRRQVKNACTNCQKACKKCDDARPCLRCVKYGVAEECVDSQRKERRKGLKRGPYKKRDGKGEPTFCPRRPSPSHRPHSDHEGPQLLTSQRLPLRKPSPSPPCRWGIRTRTPRRRRCHTSRPSATRPRPCSSRWRRCRRRRPCPSPTTRMGNTTSSQRTTPSSISRRCPARHRPWHLRWPRTATTHRARRRAIRSSSTPRRSSRPTLTRTRPRMSCRRARARSPSSPWLGPWGATRPSIPSRPQRARVPWAPITAAPADETRSSAGIAPDEMNYISILSAWIVLQSISCYAVLS